MNRLATNGRWHEIVVVGRQCQPITLQLLFGQGKTHKYPPNPTMTYAIC
jgi:hypothetical protein